MNKENETIRARLGATGLALALLLVVLPLATGRAVEDDIFLFTTAVPPNVAILMDNSGSMNHIVWHPGFDPNATPSCANWSNNRDYYFASTQVRSACGRTRNVYHDPTNPGSTRITGRYLNWLFSTEGDPFIADIDDPNNGQRFCPSATPQIYAKYQRNRMTAAKQVVLDTICQVDLKKEVRFGLAAFRGPMDSNRNDPNGGYMEVGIDDKTPAHDAELQSAIAATLANTWTPLSETLFQLYSFFMSRDPAELPPGKVNGTFPVYPYSHSPASGGGAFSAAGPPTVPADPVQYSCQKNFVILITDGQSTRDDFDADPSSTAQGFSNFDSLIGDHNADGETETGLNFEGTLYLDDIAKYMQEEDFRPDFANDQVLDVYTIGFTTNSAANAMLQKTAAQGNGLFFSSNNAEELTVAIVQSITDIIEKSQSFTASTVPSARTASGGDFYTSFFLPSAKSPRWEGHLRAFGIDAQGDLVDALGNCPLIDPTAGECNSGPFASGAAYFWDAGEEVPAPANRKLYTTELSGSASVRIDFDSNLDANALGIPSFTTPPSPSPNPIYPGSGALNEDGLAEEIVAYARGCEFGTGVSGPDVAASQSCVALPWRLGDIFHSSPVVVGKPNRASPQASYAAFKQTFAARQRVIYAGANDGFLHAFDAGIWDAGAVPPSYTRGTGQEIFGVMPSEARVTVRHLPIDDPADRHYYVDGSPTVADVWLYPTPTTATKDPSGTEWQTGLFSGMRQGGRGFFALDITDPSASNSYPDYAWDFPRFDDPEDIADPTSILPYLGESWSQPIITKVRVAVDGNDNNTQGFERWVMIVSGGFHDSGDPNDPLLYDANAYEGRSILIVDITSGELLAMKHFDPSAPAGDAQGSMRYAIPSTPAVYDLDSDGFADLIYVGDLGGQIFKWVIHPVGEDRVNDSSAVGDYSQPNWPFKLFFTAPVASVAGTDYYKSFYFPPSAALVKNQLWLATGTGERANLGFLGLAGSDENNRFYAIREDDPFELAVVPYTTFSETNLTDVTGVETCSTIANQGYYFRLADGEKVVSNSEIFSNFVLGGTFLPSTSGDPCSAKGSGKLYAFQLTCGEGFLDDGMGNPTRDIDLGAGMPADPQVSIGIDGTDNIVYVEKSGADLESIQAPDLPNNKKTLLYWRELR